MPHQFPPSGPDLTEDARHLLNEIGREMPGAGEVTAECRPPVDVLETAEALEVRMDLPGVTAGAVRVAIRRSTLLIAGAKAAGASDTTSRFHLAERSYGRFARAVRLGGAFDPTRARATLRAGELRIVLPRLPERRGRVHLVPVDAG
jgi:HSP20 family protein